MILPAELLWSYVPGVLASRFLARRMPLDAPGAERFLAAVIFADISGFTPLAERLARRGPAGAEALSNLLNDRVRAYGCDRCCWQDLFGPAVAYSAQV